MYYTVRTLLRLRACWAELYSTVILAGESDLVIPDPRCDRASQPISGYLKRG